MQQAIPKAQSASHAATPFNIVTADNLQPAEDAGEPRG